MKRKDSQKSKVVRAIWGAESEKLDEWYSPREVDDLIRRITKSDWYSEYRPPVCDPEADSRWGCLKNMSQWDRFRLAMPENIRVERKPKIRLPNVRRLRSGDWRPYDYGGIGYIRVPWKGTNCRQLMWCLAIVLSVEGPNHGRQFCAVLLELVERWVGFDDGMALRRSYIKQRVKWGPF